MRQRETETPLCLESVRHGSQLARKVKASTAGWTDGPVTDFFDKLVPRPQSLLTSVLTTNYKMMRIIQFGFEAPMVWNSIPQNVRLSSSIGSFKRSLKTSLFSPRLVMFSTQHLWLELAWICALYKCRNNNNNNNNNSYNNSILMRPCSTSHSLGTTIQTSSHFTFAFNLFLCF